MIGGLQWKAIDLVSHSALPLEEVETCLVCSCGQVWTVKGWIILEHT